MSKLTYESQRDGLGNFAWTYIYIYKLINYKLIQYKNETYENVNKC